MQTGQAETVEDEDFKTKYNILLQQFKELKEREKKNEARHRELSEELDSYERNNTDLAIKIKMIESELSGSSEKDIEELFKAEIKAKTDKVAQLQAKRNQQALAAKRKNEQNEAIIAKLKNSLKEKEALLTEKQEQSGASPRVSVDSGNSPEQASDLDKKKAELEGRLAEIDAQLREEAEKSQQLKKQLAQPSEEAESRSKELLESRAQEEARQRARIKELEELINSGNIAKDVEDKYEPLIREAEDKKARAIQEIERMRTEAKEEEQEIEALTRQIKEVSDKIKEHRRLKDEFEGSGKELSRLRREEDLQKGKIVSNSNRKEVTQQRVRDLEVENKELANLVAATKARRDNLQKEKAAIQQQTNELLAKASKADPKQHETLKRQKEQLEAELARQKARYESLKELQKTYFPESVLKQSKTELEELKQKTRGLAQAQRENQKLKVECEAIEKSIAQAKERDRRAIEDLETESTQLQQKIKELEGVNQSLTATLGQTNQKLNMYKSTFSKHEETRKEEKRKLKEEDDRRRKDERVKDKKSPQTQKTEEAESVGVKQRAKGGDKLMWAAGLLALLVLVVVVWLYS